MSRTRERKEDEEERGQELEDKAPWGRRESGGRREAEEEEGSGVGSDDAETGVVLTKD